MEKESYNRSGSYSARQRASVSDPRLTNNIDFSALGDRPRPKYRAKALWFFGLLAVVIAVFGLRYIYLNIRGSVDYKVPGFIAEQVNDQTTEQNIAALKQTDTDQDGLTDYQELYQYQTSIFLPDTDSDNYSDFEEVTKGDDPLCPQGQNCNLLALITPKTKLAEVVQGISLDPNITFKDAIAAEFRKFLIDSGIPKEQVDQLTNDDLVAMMDALESSGILNQDALSATTTPQEIRQFLLSQPNASAAEINKLSDADLLKIRDKILEK